MVKYLRLDRMNIGGKLISIFLVIGIVSISAIGYISYSSAQEALMREQFNKLTAVREMKSSEIEEYFQQIRNQIVTLSEDRMIIDAMKAFRPAFHEMDNDLGGRNLAAGDERLKGYYQNSFLPALSENLDRTPNLAKYWPRARKTRLLQDLYIADNPSPVGSKHNLDSAPDGSTYSQIHQLYHPVIRSYLEKFGYYDIFLVDPETGHIVYTVFKEVDYGTSLLDGPYSDTNFAEAFKAARASGQKDYVNLVDFAPYHPSYNAAASFVASPIFEGDEKVGVLLFQMPVDKINNVMTSNQRWADVGLGNSGETYIVGEDLTLRNQSRFLIDDRENYLRAIAGSGMEKETVTLIERTGSSIGRQLVRTKGTEAALSGQTGTDIFPDYRNVPVLSSFRPLEIADVKWVIMSEIDEAEANEPVLSLRNQVLGWAVLLLALVVVAAILMARVIARPLVSLAAVADKIGEGDLTVKPERLGSGDEVGELSAAFVSMTGGMIEVIGNLQSGVGRLTTSAREIATTAKQSAASASEQAATVAEVSTTTEEISQTSKVTAETAQAVVTAADQAVEQGRKGIEAVEEADEAMDVINERVEGVAKKILELSEQNSQIGEIVKSVNDLAEQSNLLAVNASIEAAKAGDQGRGFAVVAGEVRSLAEQSKRATQKIHKILAEIQKATQSAVMATEEGTKRVEDGQRAIKLVSGVVEELAGVLEGSSEKARQIAAAATQQASGIAEITKSMEQVAQGGKDSFEGAKQLESAAGDLNSLSEELQHAAARYQI